MNPLSQIGNEVYTQMTEGYKEIRRGYRYLYSSNYLFLSSGKSTQFGKKQAFTTSISIAFIASTIFRLLGATSIPSLAVGLAAGLVSFAHQCYINSNQSPDSVSFSVYYKCAESVNKADKAVKDLIAKCQALWNAQKKERRAAV